MQAVRYTSWVSVDVLAPKQQRSRETLARLLAATIEVLNERGLEGATLPRIAAAAGVAPASVYRRFRDRDALLRAAFKDVLEKSAASVRATARIESFKNPTLEIVARELMRALIAQNRVYRKLLHAFKRFSENDTDERFRDDVLALSAGNFEVLIDLLLHFRSEITHPNPKLAITLGLASATTAIEERALGTVTLWHRFLPLSDDELKEELARAFVAYLRS